MAKEKPETKICKHCKTEIPYGAKVCPQCRKKQGGVLKWVIIAFVAICVIGAAGGGSDNEPKETNNTNNVNDTQAVQNELQGDTKPEESQETIEYISVTATELSDALSNNAMKAQNDYKEQYLEITGKLGNIDSNGKYIAIDSDNDFDLTNIQCYIKTDEQKQIIMEMTRGDSIIIKGYCKDIGEILGYQIDIEEVVK